MADITMCTQINCPLADTCYRMQAKPSAMQSMAAFKYELIGECVECFHYYPIQGMIEIAPFNHCESIDY